MTDPLVALPALRGRRVTCAAQTKVGAKRPACREPLRHRYALRRRVNTSEPAVSASRVITARPHSETVGTGGPNLTVGIGDILSVIDGFQGKPYPGDGPLGCP